MNRTDRLLAKTAALAALFAATPAYASDFTGMLTLMFALYGGVLLTVCGSVFAISYLAKVKSTRSMVRWMGLACAIAMSVWWIAMPLPEEEAILLLPAPAILFAVLILVLERRPADQE
jgi:hypothetical protein